MKSRYRFCLRLAFALAGSPIVADAQPVPRDTAPTAAKTSGPTQTAQALAETKVTDSLVPSPIRRLPTPRRRFYFENGVKNIYDTNIERDSKNIGADGIVF